MEQGAISYLHAAVESLQLVETLQWENILTVGSSSNSGNYSTNSGNPLAFYSQQTPQKGPTQKWLMTLAASISTDKSLKDFDELMSTPIDFSRYILNGLKIKNLT
ncbi:hypothetical protein Tco_1030218 [Tanacetum coccineum]|uniref:Uncharacterized protein n=1 Tax=Tanacetum coccineum TaxID=301880 RepID=A0ABQ5G7G0_9ASTR